MASNKIQGVRGMNDLLPDEAERWEAFEEIVRDWLKSYSVILTLVKNPRTPLATSINLLQRLQARDLLDGASDSIERGGIDVTPDGAGGEQRLELRHRSRERGEDRPLLGQPGLPLGQVEPEVEEGRDLALCAAGVERGHAGGQAGGHAAGGDERLVHRRIARDAARPRPLGFDEAARAVPEPRPVVASIQHRLDRVGDIWLRDTAPVFLTDSRGTLATARFTFNGWGEKQDFDQDGQVAAFVAAAFLASASSTLPIGLPPFLYSCSALTMYAACWPPILGTL